MDPESPIETQPDEHADQLVERPVLIEVPDNASRTRRYAARGPDTTVEVATPADGQPVWVTHVHSPPTMGAQLCDVSPTGWCTADWGPLFGDLPLAVAYSENDKAQLRVLMTDHFRGLPAEELGPH